MKNKKALKRLLVLLLAVMMVTSLSGCFITHHGTSNEEEKPEPKPDDSETIEPEDTDSDDGSVKPASEGQEGGQTATAEEIAAEQKAFSEFIASEFKDAIENSYFATHIYYIHPEEAGIDLSNIEVSFGTAPTDESYQESREYYDEAGEKFGAFNRSLLTPEQQVEYDAYKWEFTISRLLADEKFDYYDQYFAPPNSLDANLVSYLSNWDIRHERDAQDMVTLLKSIPAYVESAITYSKEQQQRELLMTNFDTVIEGAQDVLDMGMDSSVLSNMLEKIDNLEIDQAKKDEYKQGITDAFRDSYLPSFQLIIDAMEEMKGGYNNEESYAAFPNGSEYYAALLMYNTGTLDSADDIYDYLATKSDKLLNDLFKVYSKYSAEVEKYYDGSMPGTGYASYEEILEANKTALLQDHPEVKNLEYHIEDADPEEKLAEKNIAAYFLIPPLDGDRLQQMRVEPTGSNIESLDTFTTVSHEGFPGHMYHYAYMYSNIESPYIKTLGVDAFVEGYAVYSQLEALDYLENMPKGYKELETVSTGLTYADYTLADIGINYYGWSKKEMQKFFTDIGYSVDEEAAQEIYDYLRCCPATYAPYGYGYLRVADLRDRAKKELGDKFTKLGFNTALLKAGPVPFSIIEKDIDQYIADNK